MNTLAKFRLAVVALSLLASSVAVEAKPLNDKEPVVSTNGFWVIETAPENATSTVRFYTNDQRLIYQETVNQKLNIHRRKIKQRLTIALEQAMFVWNATHQIPTDRQWVSVLVEK
ncbi:hypothetical protein GCM10028805_10120 [Spirosoma harenae]